jgi:hypothetical protein
MDGIVKDARFERQSCGGKERYPTRAAAEAHLRLIAKREKGFALLEVYACVFCDGFHFGHPMTAKNPRFLRSQR